MDSETQVKVLDSSQGCWYYPSPRGDFYPSGRGGHCCTSLNSCVFIFGGADRLPTPFDDIWALDTEADLYRWTKLSPPFFADNDVLSRTGATITALDDALYVYGGQDPLTGVVFTDVLEFDLGKKEWQRLDVSGELPPPRHSHIAARIGQHAILYYGGASMMGPLGDIWILNTANKTWTRPSIAGQAPSVREMAAAVMLDATRLLIYGGRDADGQVLNDLHVLDLNNMAWSNRALCAFPRCSHSIVPLDRRSDAKMTTTTHAAAFSSPPTKPVVAEPTSSLTPSPLVPNANQRLSSSSCLIREFLVYGGWTGTEVSGDLLTIDPDSLKISMRHQGPRADEFPAPLSPPTIETETANATTTNPMSEPGPEGDDDRMETPGPLGAGGAWKDRGVSATPARNAMETDGEEGGGPFSVDRNASRPPPGDDVGVMGVGQGGAVVTGLRRRAVFRHPRGPKPRFAHVACAVPDPAGEGQMLLVMGGVTYAEDLKDVAIWRYSQAVVAPEKEEEHEEVEAANMLLNLL